MNGGQDSVASRSASSVKQQTQMAVKTPSQAPLAPDCLEKPIDLLRRSNSCEWMDVVDAPDKDGLCKHAAAFKVRQRCQRSCQACIFALASMNQQSNHDVPNKTWLNCCNDAAGECLNPARIEAAKSGETIQRWNRQLRRLDKFQHPDPMVHCGRSTEPSVFEPFPEFKETVKRFSDGNLADLTT
jgi:hypothetical protein